MADDPYGRRGRQYPPPGPYSRPNDPQPTQYIPRQQESQHRDNGTPPGAYRESVYRDPDPRDGTFRNATFRDGLRERDGPRDRAAPRDRDALRDNGYRDDAHRHDRYVRPDGRTGPVNEGRTDASPWNWLLWIPIAIPLMPILYNDMEPRFLGIPFYYWSQLAFAGLASLVLLIVHLATKKAT